MIDINATVFPTMTGRGLTKRELFAAMAMQGLLANKSHPGHWSAADDSTYCVQIADELLAALAKDAP